MIRPIINHIVSSIHAPIREYNPDGQLINFYGDAEKKDILSCDAGFLQQLLHSAKTEMPVIYKEFYPIYYGILQVKPASNHSHCENYNCNNSNDCNYRNYNLSTHTYILGPVNIDLTLTAMEQQPLGEYYAHLHALPVPKYRISYCSHKDFCEEYLLLYNCLTGQDCTYQQLCCQSAEPEQVEYEVHSARGEIYFHYQENEKVHNSYDHEVRELNSIREGDIQKLKLVMEEVIEGDFAVLSRDPLRSLKNLMIVSLALVARAAIDGGMNPEDSFSINDSYILKVDAAASIEQIAALDYQAKTEYASLVHDLQGKKEDIALIEKAKRAIFRDMHKKIIVKEIAAEIHVTPEYLSALFRKKEGITVNDYIMREKVHLAENLLMYSKYSMTEISFYFGFCSQSHFGKIFKKWKNMTPGQYREKYAVRSFME